MLIIPVAPAAPKTIPTILIPVSDSPRKMRAIISTIMGLMVIRMALFMAEVRLNPSKKHIWFTATPVSPHSRNRT
jgi:hypothetical protein